MLQQRGQDHQESTDEASTQPFPPEPAESDLLVAESPDNQPELEEPVQAESTSQPDQEHEALHAEELAPAENGWESGSAYSQPYSERVQAVTDEAESAAASEDSPDTEQSVQAPASTAHFSDSQRPPEASEGPVQEAVSPSEPQPESNGCTLAHATDESIPVSDESIHQVTDATDQQDHLTATAADSQVAAIQSLDPASQQAPPMQESEHQQAQQQLPVPSLYTSSRVDQSSRHSLPESDQTAPDIRQSPASTSDHGEATVSGSAGIARSEASGGHVNGIVHEAQQGGSEQQAGSHQSSQDNHEQQADTAGTPHMLCCTHHSSLPSRQ